MKCAECKFWVDIFSGKIGECRHAPPAPLIGPVEGASRVAAWPRTSNDDFCGGFSARVEKRAAFV